MNNVLARVRLTLNNTQKVYIYNVTLKVVRPNHPNNCMKLNLNEITKENINGLKQISVNFHKKGQYEVELRIEDRQESVTRAFKYNQFGNFGQNLGLKIHNNLYKYYAVKFHQNIFVEDDPTNLCKIYPNNEFKSYEDCDADFTKRHLETEYPSGFLPVWATDDLAKVTQKWIIDDDFTNKVIPYTDLVLGTAVNDCPLPCTTTQITAVFLDEKTEKNSKYSKIDIAFSDTVTVTKNVFPKFNPAEFLSELGGSMGFWLGLGVVQTLELVFCFVRRAFK